MTIGPKLARTSATVGLIVICGLVLLRTDPAPETDLINKLLLLAVLVIVPLGLTLAATPDANGNHFFAYRLAVALQPVGAVCATGSLFLDQSLTVGLLAAIWFAVTILIAVFGLWRVLKLGLNSAAEISLDAGLIFLPVGGAWLVAARLGIQPLGFGDTIVLLTAVHFHFARFASPILAGLAGRAIQQRQTGQ